MNINRFVSVICEYNPFHFGHLYQLNEFKKSFDGVVCIMSGDIVQRGSAAVASKYIRAEAALKNGANLVVELPVPYCCASARDFARAGVFIASALGSHSLGFGAEDDRELIFDIYKFISDKGFNEKLKSLIEKSGNLSYPAALNLLIKQSLGEKAAESATKPNNILSLEYLVSLSDTDITPFIVARDSNFLSSSAIRAEKESEKILNLLPENSKNVFKNHSNEAFPRKDERLNAYFVGTLRNMYYNKIPENVYSAPKDLIVKIITAARKFSTVDEIVSACCDKNYTAARVRRAINSTVFEINSESVAGVPKYTCVLAADSIGREIIKNAKARGMIDIITKPVKVDTLSEETKKAFYFAKRIEDIVALSSNEAADIGKTPFISE